MTTTQPVEDILRPLVEARERRLRPLSALEQGDPRGLTPEEWEDIPDPRFEALRRACSGCSLLPTDGPYLHKADCMGYSIDASVGALLRAAAACGRWEMEKVLDALLQWCDTSQWDPLFLTPEEAAARALVAAWNDEKAARLTG